MAPKLDYEWRLRALLADRGIYTTAQLSPHLESYGIRLSDSQVYRLLTGKPERLNLRVLMALCELLDCTPTESDQAGREQRSDVGRAASCRGGGCRCESRSKACSHPPRPARSRPWLKRSACHASVGAVATLGWWLDVPLTACRISAGSAITLPPVVARYREGSSAATCAARSGCWCAAAVVLARFASGAMSSRSMSVECVNGPSRV